MRHRSPPPSAYDDLIMVVAIFVVALGIIWTIAGQPH